jgi:predicted Zn-dependent protease
VGACSGAVHQLPLVDQNNLNMAQAEVQKAGGVPQRHQVSDDEAIATMKAAIDRIRPAALQVCHEMNVGVCEWHFAALRDRSLNASAGANGSVVVNRGVVEYSATEEEVMVVIAHEIGHQAANHLAKNQQNQMVGALVGGLLFGVLGAVATSKSRNSGYITAQAAQSGSQIGAAIGRVSYSKEQEREADYLAALILYRSGVDLDKARGMLVTLARASGRKETGMLDSHPAGPERLAAWDKAVQEIRASNGALPKRQ